MSTVCFAVSPPDLRHMMQSDIRLQPLSGVLCVCLCVESIHLVVKQGFPLVLLSVRCVCTAYVRMYMLSVVYIVLLTQGTLMSRDSSTCVRVRMYVYECSAAQGRVGASRGHRSVCIL